MIIHNDLFYTKDHEWVRIVDGIATLGITEYAQGELGDIVFIELPNIGVIYQPGDSVAVIEAVKTVADIYTPIKGKVSEINIELEDKPELINKFPYNKGWIIKLLDITDISDIEVLNTFWSDIDVNSMAHNLIIRDDLVYVSHYHDGLYIFSIRDPNNIVLVGYYDTYLPADHDSYKGAWGVYPLLPSGNVLISDMQTGLYIFDVSDAVNLSLKENDKCLDDLKMNCNGKERKISKTSIENIKKYLMEL